MGEQLDAIRASALEIISEQELEKKLRRAAANGNPLVVKQGFDPTRPDLHIGHAVSLRMLELFQQLGHQVVFVVGDYTARVGDPSGRSELRPALSEREIRANAATYQEQLFTILDRERTRVEFNSSWLAPLALSDLLLLTSRYTVARMLERDDFRKRMESGSPVSVMEFLYPLLQAYDSLALKADVELGGSDQRFNLLIARQVQERYGQEPQICLLMPLLRGTDGERKMSKSYDNYIGLAEAPEEQYGKAMSISDQLLPEWLGLASGLAGNHLEKLRILAGEDPYAAKRELAARIVEQYHGASAAREAAERFDLVHRRHQVPGDTPLVELSPGDPSLAVADGRVWLPRLLVAAGLAGSNSEGVRLIEQGAISLDGETARGTDATVPAGGERLIRRGKRRFARVRFGD